MKISGWISQCAFLCLLACSSDPEEGSNGGGGMSGASGASGASGSGGGGAGGSGSGGMNTAALQYFAGTCAPCHGTRGEGVPTLGPDLQHPVRDYSTWVVRNGRQGHPDFRNGIMLAYGTTELPDATLNAIFDSLSAPAVPKPTTGELLYKDYCANCHGANGVGGASEHDAKGQPLSKALEMVRNGHDGTQFEKRTGYMPKWSATDLTDAEVGLIVTYLDSL